MENRTGRRWEYWTIFSKWQQNKSSSFLGVSRRGHIIKQMTWHLSPTRRAKQGGISLPHVTRVEMGVLLMTTFTASRVLMVVNDLSGILHQRELITYLSNAEQVRVKIHQHYKTIIKQFKGYPTLWNTHKTDWIFYIVAIILCLFFC